ncbi:KEOPS complex subunit Cgi121 [Natrialba taiwanensis]|uniref:KEOPS complex Cgi121-like subunit n=1 Tax=Natrialba taiwanensis DSM 12281 TaxID=1230458 RepID=L9ZNE1_9EURY|nr:KEOPS complex subunit Cgi121 [Natrialba taiwanensis]ELY88020.1 KEOPS complex Cgi121-like subunit [Natrialba taiwanensis DSM 12281]
MDLLECRLDIDDIDSFVADLTVISERHGTTLQTVDARYVADRRHLERAVELADRAIERDENVARDRAVEILLYAAGRRQIDRALEMGVGEGENRAVVLIDAAPHSNSKTESNLDAARTAVTELEAFAGSEPTLDHQDKGILQTFFDITDAERAATDASLAALVRERVALLDVEK